jgi:lambda family phage minor tail protein L
VSDIDNLIQTSSLPNYIELFIIDCTSIPAIGTIYYLTPSGTESATVQFNGHTYTPFPMELSGVAETSSEAPARPTLSLSNINNIFGSLSFNYSDLVGCKVTYIRTFTNYLGLSGTISAPPKKYLIRKKSKQDRNAISFELGTFLDSERGYLPKRQMLKRDFPGLGINKIMR